MFDRLINDWDAFMNVMAVLGVLLALQAGSYYWKRIKAEQKIHEQRKRYRGGKRDRWNSEEIGRRKPK